MRFRRGIAAVLAALVASLGAASCGKTGQLIVVVQSDMSMPKDIDSIEIEASVLGTVKYKNAFTGIGTESSTDNFKVPATLALLAPEDAGTPVKIRVVGRKGFLLSVAREVVTTVPEDRAATLNVKLESLCLGFEQENLLTGVVTSACEGGQTCIAGSCTSSELSSGQLANFDESAIFGGGTGHGDGSCFDVLKCFQGAKILDRLGGSDCTFEAPSEGLINIALLTEITGMCGLASCLVALDAGSTSGWTLTEAGQIALPSAVCDPTGPTAALGVVYAPVTSECAQKTLGLPTCGAWSSAGQPPDPPATPTPIAMATFQAHPVSLVVENTGIYWTNSGVVPANPKTPASVRRSFPDGGGIGMIETPLSSPRGVAVGRSDAFFTNEMSGDAMDEVTRVSLANFINMGGPLVRLGNPASTVSPEGIAVASGETDTIFWTEFATGSVRRAALDKDGKLINSMIETIDINLKHPLRVAATPKLACWTDEGTLGEADGSVTCVDATAGGGAALSKWKGQATPRALAITNDGTVYWATFTYPGSILKVTPPGDEAKNPPQLVWGDAKYPNGVAVDSNNVYWTNYVEGTIWKRPISLSEEPVMIASGQNRPSIIAVNDTAIYWINEGDPGEANGSVIRLAKQ